MVDESKEAAAPNLPPTDIEKRSAIEQLRARIAYPTYYDLTGEEAIRALGAIAVVEALDALRQEVANSSAEMELLRRALPEIAKAINNYTEERFHTTR